MAIRTVKQRSDRGSIKDIKASNEEVQEFPYAITHKNLDPTKTELRLQKLYEFAQHNNDADLLSATGFITTNYIADKNALPLSIYRLRKTVDDIKSKSGNRINEWAAELSGCFTESLSDALGQEYTRFKSMVKNASPRKPPKFWRVDK